MPKLYTKTCKHLQCDKTYTSFNKHSIKQNMRIHLANKHGIFDGKEYHECNEGDCNRKVFDCSTALKYHQRRKHKIHTHEERISYKYEEQCDIILAMLEVKLVLSKLGVIQVE